MKPLHHLVIHKCAKISDKSNPSFKDSTATHWQSFSQPVAQLVFFDKLHVSRASAYCFNDASRKQQKVRMHLEVRINTEVKVISRCMRAQAMLFYWDNQEKKEKRNDATLQLQQD